MANLWDVTDKDIDRLSEAVFLDLGVGVEAPPAATTKGKGRAAEKTKVKPAGKTTAQAVGQARDKCKLKYLTGAAVVVYGVPVRM